MQKEILNIVDTDEDFVTFITMMNEYSFNEYSIGEPKKGDPESMFL